MHNVVGHAALGNQFFIDTKGSSLSCLEACPVVRWVLRRVEEWARHHLGAVPSQAWAMPIVQASPLQPMLCRRSEELFGQMAKYWLYYY